MEPHSNRRGLKVIQSTVSVEHYFEPRFYDPELSEHEHFDIDTDDEDYKVWANRNINENNFNLDPAAHSHKQRCQKRNCCGGFCRDTSQIPLSFQSPSNVEMDHFRHSNSYKPLSSIPENRYQSGKKANDHSFEDELLKEIIIQGDLMHREKRSRIKHRINHNSSSMNKSRNPYFDGELNYDSGMEEFKGISKSYNSNFHPNERTPTYQDEEYTDLGSSKTKIQKRKTEEKSKSRMFFELIDQLRRRQSKKAELYKYADNEMTENEKTENEITENETTENEMTENEMTENEMTENEITENEITENEVTDNERSFDQKWPFRWRKQDLQPTKHTASSHHHSTEEMKDKIRATLTGKASKSKDSMKPYLKNFLRSFYNKNKLTDKKQQFSEKLHYSSAPGENESQIRNTPNSTFVPTSILKKTAKRFDPAPAQSSSDNESLLSLAKFTISMLEDMDLPDDE